MKLEIVPDDDHSRPKGCVVAPAFVGASLDIVRCVSDQSVPVEPSAELRITSLSSA